MDVQKLIAQLRDVALLPRDWLNTMETDLRRMACQKFVSSIYPVHSTTSLHHLAQQTGLSCTAIILGLHFETATPNFYMTYRWLSLHCARLPPIPQFNIQFDDVNDKQFRLCPLRQNLLVHAVLCADPVFVRFLLTNGAWDIAKVEARRCSSCTNRRLCLAKRTLLSLCTTAKHSTVRKMIKKKQYEQTVQKIRARIMQQKRERAIHIVEQKRHASF
ncbi:hypothetical protein OAM67_00125 [bacterium]|nr:hypothetical protein [bacterium]